jgi:hypothetical protein
MKTSQKLLPTQNIPEQPAAPPPPLTCFLSGPYKHNTPIFLSQLLSLSCLHPEDGGNKILKMSSTDTVISQKTRISINIVIRTTYLLREKNACTDVKTSKFSFV